MRHRVPYLADELIERDAIALLSEFECARGVMLEPPVPIEDIIEKHLKLPIEFNDMHKRHKVPRPANGETDILGAIYGDGSIFIDESLDPDEKPSMEGRYRFTLAHEGGGHWRLHQPLIRNDSGKSSRLNDSGDPKFLCRSSQKPREELQADIYASCLLMPRNLVFRAWKREFGDLEPRGLIGFRGSEDNDVEIVTIRSCRDGAGEGAAPSRPRSVRTGKHRQPWRQPSGMNESLREIGEIYPEVKQLLREDMSSRRDPGEIFLEDVARPLAEQFEVSPIAMRIRLEKLGLLHPFEECFVTIS